LFLVPPNAVDFVARLQKDFMMLVFPNLGKDAQDAIANQTEPKDLRGGGVKIRSAIVDATVGMY
jgi:hypothetical protein